MAAYTNDDGTQTITFDYLQNATSQSFNNLLRKLMKAGIYEGGLLSAVNDTTVSLASYVAVVNAENSDDVAIRVSTADAYNVTVSTTFPIVVLRFEWQQQEANFVQAIAKSQADIDAEDPTGKNYVIVGECVFSGSVLTGFDYTNREQVSKDADTIHLGAAYSIDSNPVGGTQSQFIGSSTYVTQVLTDIYNRLINLSGVSNAAAKKRHIDLTVGGGIHGNNLLSGLELTHGGATAGSYSNSTILSSVLQNILNLLKDLSGADNDSVLRRHVNFGSGSDQISLKDFSMGNVGSGSIDGSFSDVSYGTGDSLANVLTSIFGVIDEIASAVNSNTSFITDTDTGLGSLQSEFRFSQLPVGSMMMFDAAGWVNDNTIPGWYACDGNNGTPDLKNKFIKAHSAGAHSSNPTNNAGGSNNVTLALGNIPAHTHPLNFISGSGSAASAGDHTHGYTGDNGASQRGDGGNSARNNAPAGKTTGPASALHTHAVTITALNASVGSTGSASPTPLTINPEHYSVIFIRKMS